MKPPYRLLTEPEPYPGLRPSYTHGNRTGTAGPIAVPLAFGSHPAAITILGAPRMPYAPYVLTPADICDLRLSMRKAPAASAMDHSTFGRAERDTGAPYILYLSADDAYLLRAYGSAQCTHANPAILAACLRNERAEPGFIRRVLDPSYTIEEASLDPAGALASRRHRERLNHDAKARSDEADEARRAFKFKRTINVTEFDLDDLFTP